MLAIEIEAIHRVACLIRQAIELCPKHQLPIGFEAFPRGSCADASLVLGTHLHQTGFAGFGLVLAGRGSWADSTWTSHAWVEKDGLIVDITADQFSDFDSRVFVGRGSGFHRGFEVQQRSPSLLEQYDPGSVRELMAAYRAIVAIVEMMPT